MLRLAILASGEGSNLQSILDAFEAGKLGSFLPVLIVVDRECGAILKGMDAGINTVMLDRKVHSTDLSREVGEILDEEKIQFVALAGWLSIFDEALTRIWEKRMVNIHPSLLPKHGGSGMYGVGVHKAVLEAGDKESGCSIHYVTAGVDEGEVIGQSRVPVLYNDTPESLAARVLVEEHKLYPEILAKIPICLKDGLWFQLL